MVGGLLGAMGGRRLRDVPRPDWEHARRRRRRAEEEAPLATLVGPARFYFPAAAAAVNPAFAAGWGTTVEAVRRRLARGKGSSAIADGTDIGPWTAGQSALDRQYVSDPLAAGVRFLATDTYKLQLMVRELQLTDNVVSIVVGLRVVSGDGNTVRATLSDPAQGGPATEFVNLAPGRNKTWTGAGTEGLDYTTQAGDRLVVEIGYTDSAGTTPEAVARWGENAADLPENETQTTDGAGWIELSTPMAFL